MAIPVLVRRAILGLCALGWLVPMACGSGEDEAVAPADALSPDASKSDCAPSVASPDSSDFVPHEQCLLLPERLDTSGTVSAPSLGSSSEDGLFAVWSEAVDGGARRIVTRRQSDSSSGWRDAVTLTESSVSSVRFAVAPSGGATIAWLSDVGGSHGERATFLGSRKWSAVERFQDPMALDGTSIWLAAAGSTNALAFVVDTNGVLETQTQGGADAGWARETFATDGVVEPRVDVAPTGDHVVVWYTASPSAVHLRTKRAGVWAPALASAAASFTTTGAAQLFEPALLPLTLCGVGPG